MKQIIIIILLLNSLQLFTQLKIKMQDGKKYEGVPTFESNDSLNIILLDGTYRGLNKNLIKKKTQMLSKIQLKNGQEIIGAIQTFDEEHFNLQIQERDTSKQIQIESNNVKKIEFKNQLNSSYGALAFSLGTPGLYNLTYSYYYNNFGIRASLGLKNTGYQFNIFHSLINSESFEIGVSLCYGHLEYSYETISINLPFGRNLDDNLIDFKVCSPYDPYPNPNLVFVNRTYVAPILHLYLYGFYMEFGMGHEIIGKKATELLIQLGFMLKDNIF